MEKESALRGVSPVSLHDLFSLCLDHAGLGTPPGKKVGFHEPDWERALPVLRRHALIPLASTVRSTSTDLPTSPPGYREALQARTRSVVMRHKLSLVILGKLDRLMKEHSIPYAVLKGPHLYEAYYRDLFPRPCDDIDILVKKKDLDRALGVLAAFGYGAVGSGLGRLALRWGHFHLVARHERGAFPPVELHWELVDRANLYRIPGAEIFGSIVPLSAGRVSFSVLPPEENFMYLCLHAAKHGIINELGMRQNCPPRWFCDPAAGNRLIWYIDLMLLLETEWERLSWDLIARRAVSRNTIDEIILSLAVLGLLFPSSRAAEGLKHLGGADRLTVPRSGPLSKFLRTRRGRRIFGWSMEMHRGLFVRPARLFLLGQLLFPAPRKMRRCYPRTHPLLLPFLYLLHPWKMLLKQISPG